jgi:hypothetical protein
MYNMAELGQFIQCGDWVKGWKTKGFGGSFPEEGTEHEKLIFYLLRTNQLVQSATGMENVLSVTSPADKWFVS